MGVTMLESGMWLRGPVGLGAEQRVTRAGCRQVLAMVPTVTAGSRLLDLIPLLEADARIQLILTIPGSDRWHGTEDFVRQCGVLALPWQQALQHRWDLVLSASHRHIEQVHGPLLVTPHGAGALKSRLRSRKAGTPTQDTTGLDRELLTYRGRVVPSAIAVANELERAALTQLCPEAAALAVVTGDVCFDRMMASETCRSRYRQALDVDDNQQLIVVSSSWSPDSVFGRHPELYRRLLEEPDDGVRVAAVLHPNIWSVHGVWQVRAWLAPALRRGLLLIPPDDGWQATMIASDHVIGDHGSTTSYAAALGRSVHLANPAEHPLRAGSIASVVAETVPVVDHQLPLLPQLRQARRPLPRPEVVGRITDRPGEAARILRTTMYRLLGLSEPSWDPVLPPAAVPRPLS